MDYKAIKDLVLCSFYGRTPDPTKYSVQDVKDTTREEIHKIAHDYYSFMKNHVDLFEILSEVYTEAIPKKVEEFMQSFAEVRTVPNMQKAQFVVKTGRRRAKQFVTQVGLSGVYESFRLDTNTFEVGGRAIGGAAYIDFERYIAGDEDISESIDILYEGYTEAVYGEIQKALLASVNASDRPENNKFISAGFDPTLMAEACMVAGTYGDGVTIFAPPEFVAAMGPEAVGMPVVVGTGVTGGVATPVYNPANIDEIARYGKIKTFRGYPIVEIPQSFTDNNNEVTVTNPAVAYIFPNGKEKVVKVVFEGPIQFDQWQHRDRSFEVEIYGKVGVAILSQYDWCVYVNTDLQAWDEHPTLYPTNFSAD